MREGIHPEYPIINVSCACGFEFQTRSTRGNFTVDVCSHCHPFYTGKQRFVDSAGRVDRFLKKFSNAKAQQAQAVVQKKAKAKKDAASEN